MKDSPDVDFRGYTSKLKQSTCRDGRPRPSERYTCGEMTYGD